MQLKLWQNPVVPHPPHHAHVAVDVAAPVAASGSAVVAVAAHFAAAVAAPAVAPVVVAAPVAAPVVAPPVVAVAAAEHDVHGATRSRQYRWEIVGRGKQRIVVAWKASHVTETQ